MFFDEIYVFVDDEGSVVAYRGVALEVLQVEQLLAEADQAEGEEQLDLHAND